MRLTTAIFLAFLADGVHAAGDRPTLDSIHRLAQTGAPELALARLEREQPARREDAGWLDWEMERLALLDELKQPENLLKRLDAFPVDAPAVQRTKAYMYGARAALRLKQGARSRAFLARLLWQGRAPENREARLMVVDSYLADTRPEPAYLAMLRFQQDFAPVDRGVAERFVGALLRDARATEALTWLPALDPVTPLALLLKLNSGMVDPQAAIAEAQAAVNPPPPPEQPKPAVVKKPVVKGKKRPVAEEPVVVQPARTVKPLDPAVAAGYWAVIRRAAEMQHNLPLAVEARERLLALWRPELPPLLEETPQALWKDYDVLAQLAANQANLLAGDDPAWLALAERLATAEPVKARALYAYLAVNGEVPAQREEAQIRLADLLLQHKLPIAAVRLFAEPGRFVAPRTLSPQVRYLVGENAVQRNDYAAAALLWRALPQPPQAVDLQAWRLKRARALLRGGEAAEAAPTLGLWLQGEAKITGPTGEEFAGLLHELSAGRHFDLASDLAGRALPAAEGRTRRELLLMLARIAEMRQESLAAADYYLQVADRSAPPALNEQARLAAADNLLRAGLVHDAKAQYRILLDTVQDAEKQAAIRRAMSGL